MTLKDGFLSIKKTNQRVSALAKKGLLDEAEIAKIAAEYKTIWELIGKSQMEFMQAAMIENLTVKCRDMFFDTINKIDKDAPKQ